jgi:hypothetical protein
MALLLVTVVALKSRYLMKPFASTHRTALHRRIGLRRIIFGDCNAIIVIVYRSYRYIHREM